VSRGSGFARRSALLGLAAALFPVGGCTKPHEHHPQDVAALTAWVPPPATKPPRFETVPEVERAGLPPSEKKPYRLGIDDVVEVRVLAGSPVRGFEVPVTAIVKADGSLSLPVAMRVEALDKTPLEVEAAIAAAIVDYVADAVVSVHVVEYRARKARVLGDGVEREAYLSVDGRKTLLEALIETGATRKPEADREEAYLIRARKVYAFSIAEMVESAHPSGDVVLEEGDHVVVHAFREREDYVYVTGQVLRPGRFRMDQEGREWERGRLTLMGAVAQAGGLNEATADCNLCLFRGGCRDLRVFRLGIHELYRCGESIALQPGDRVYVSASALAKFNMGLSHFLPFVSGTSGVTSLALSAAAFAQTSN
jgi:protein involved in polysaccharide export with SLBB domain